MSVLCASIYQHVNKIEVQSLGRGPKFGTNVGKVGRARAEGRRKFRDVYVSIIHVALGASLLVLFALSFLPRISEFLLYTVPMARIVRLTAGYMAMILGLGAFAGERPLNVIYKGIYLAQEQAAARFERAGKQGLRQRGCASGVGCTV